uniref:Uncharacterized protein n=1 Tax=Mycena chlorophos TaxID=658473 RepID=A0ABQ0KZD9_MYCCL|nr:predicted protein [Mycena chlorophos]
MSVCLNRVRVALGRAVPAMLVRHSQTSPSPLLTGTSRDRAEIRRPMVPLHTGHARRVLARVALYPDHRPPLALDSLARAKPWYAHFSMFHRRQTREVADVVVVPVDPELGYAEIADGHTACAAVVGAVEMAPGLVRRGERRRLAAELEWAGCAGTEQARQDGEFYGIGLALTLPGLRRSLGVDASPGLVQRVRVGSWWWATTGLTHTLASFGSKTRRGGLGRNGMGDDIWKIERLQSDARTSNPGALESRNS